MKTRIRESVNESNGKTVYICEYKYLFWWRACNTIVTNFPGPTYRQGYPLKKYAESRIQDFLNGVP